MQSYELGPERCSCQDPSSNNQCVLLLEEGGVPAPSGKQSAMGRGVPASYSLDKRFRVWRWPWRTHERVVLMVDLSSICRIPRGFRRDVSTTTVIAEPHGLTTLLTTTAAIPLRNPILFHMVHTFCLPGTHLPSTPCTHRVWPPTALPRFFFVLVFLLTCWVRCIGHGEFLRRLRL